MGSQRCKVRYITDLVNEKFKDHYTPSQIVNVDESMFGMKSRFLFIQYMPDLA